jgi:hypothetical protein
VGITFNRKDNVYSMCLATDLSKEMQEKPGVESTIRQAWEILITDTIPVSEDATSSKARLATAVAHVANVSCPDVRFTRMKAKVLAAVLASGEATLYPAPSEA